MLTRKQRLLVVQDMILRPNTVPSGPTPPGCEQDGSCSARYAAAICPKCNAVWGGTGFPITWPKPEVSFTGNVVDLNTRRT